MGTTSGIICLGIGIFSLIASIWHPGTLILAAVALYAAYANLKGTGKIFYRSPPPIHNTEAETVVCPHCTTENLAVASACRGCGKSLTNTQNEVTVTAG